MNEQIIDTLYEAAVVNSRWADFLHGLLKPAGAAAAICSRVSGDRMDFLSTSPAFKEACDLVVREHGGAGNDRTRRLVGVPHAGFVTDSDVFAPGEAEALPIYRDIFIPRGFGSGVGTSIAVPGGDHVLLHLEKPWAEGRFEQRIVTALDRLRPHFARAAFISHRLDIERARTIAHALEAVGLPAAVLGRRGKYSPPMRAWSR